MPTNKTSADKADKADTAQRLLEALTEKPESTAAELAEATGLGRSTISRLLAKLQRDDQVTRTRGERDGRRRGADQWSKTTSERLRPGQLDDIVMKHMLTLTEPAGSVAVGRALGRSTGAVANCMKRRAKVGDLKQVEDKPLRYEASRV
ncbi:MAG: transcriptional regulator [Conexibacter sp.]|nr:transcriptional regulator [Conexibacter sp.]